MTAGSSLDIAYKYPFSQEAKAVVEGAGSQVSYKYLVMAQHHIESALDKGIPISDTALSSTKTDYIMTYLYSRMLVSAAARRDIIANYAAAEAKRSSVFLSAAAPNELIGVGEELGLHITPGVAGPVRQFTMGFSEFLRYSPQVKGITLVNQRLNHGIVLLNDHSIARLMQEAIRQQIASSLPIPKSELPPEVVDYSKTMRLNVKEKIVAKRSPSASHNWIERLLVTPIADVRHRTVNLILAPYLTNVKGMGVEEATRRIMEYIEMCKGVDPSTRINEAYVRYQCNYAKRKGSKPLSLTRAKELLGATLNTEILEGR